MLMILMRIWPALVPLALYISWLLIKRRHARRNGLALPTFFSGPWLWVLGSAFALLAASFFYVGLSAPRDFGLSYQPAQLKNGKVIPPKLLKPESQP